MDTEIETLCKAGTYKVVDIPKTCLTHIILRIALLTPGPHATSPVANMLRTPIRNNLTRHYNLFFFITASRTRTMLNHIKAILDTPGCMVPLEIIFKEAFEKIGLVIRNTKWIRKTD